MDANPVDWFEIYVQDMDWARKFYELVLGVKLDVMKSPETEMCTFPMGANRPGADGALVRMEGVASGGNSTLVYFFSKDCSIEQGRAAEFGGSVHKGKLAIGDHGFISLVLDTEGNMFGLHSMK